MARTYDATRRQEAAHKTREAILAAAFVLHGQGIFNLEPLAEAANVSVATVRKHFPNRELLFEGCTAYGLHQVTMPDFAALSRITDWREQLAAVARDAYALHEALFGQVWGAYRLEDESPVLARSLTQVHGAVEALADLVVAAWPNLGDDAPELRGLATALLGPLAYRALRVQGGLTPEQASRHAAAFLLHAFEAATPAGTEAAHR